MEIVTPQKTLDLWWNVCFRLKMAKLIKKLPALTATLIEVAKPKLNTFVKYARVINIFNFIRLMLSYGWTRTKIVLKNVR